MFKKKKKKEEVKDIVTPIATVDNTIYGYMVNEYNDVVLVATLYDNVNSKDRQILDRQSMVLSERILMLGVKLNEVPMIEDNENSDIYDSIYEDVDLNKLLEEVDDEFIEILKSVMDEGKSESFYEEIKVPYILGIKAALKDAMPQLLPDGYVHLWTSGRRVCTHYYGRHTSSNHLQIKCIKEIEPLDHIFAISNITVHANIINNIVKEIM